MWMKAQMIMNNSVTQESNSFIGTFIYICHDAHAVYRLVMLLLIV